MTWFDKSRASRVDNAVFPRRSEGQKPLPAWLAGQKPKPAPLSTWLSNQPEPTPQAESCTIPRSPLAPAISVPGAPPSPGAERKAPLHAVVPRRSQPPPAPPEGPTVPKESPSRTEAVASVRPEPVIPMVDEVRERERDRKVAAAVASLEKSIGELGALHQEAAQHLQEQLVSLAGIIARRVIGRELEMNPELISALALEGIEALGERNKIQVRVGPVDNAAIDTMTERLRRRSPQVEIVVDPSLDPGQCLLRSEFGQVDESLDTRLGTLMRALVGADANQGER